MSNVPTSVRDWGATDGLQGAYGPEEVLGVATSNEFVVMRPKLIAKRVGLLRAGPNAESRRAAGNIGPQAAESAEDSTEGVSSVGNIGPQVGNVVPQTAEAVEEDAESAYGVGNIVPHKVEGTEMMNESATCISSVGNRVPLGVKKTSTRTEVSLNTSRVDNQVPHSKSETPPARPVENQHHVLDGVPGRQVKAGAVHLEALPEVSALMNL
ncbi:Pol protein [Phytophthora palmivora]|uniref:Pol protein n=1 Tax=Phytophthora palmivora TaxID=4796 RepID=A0A2P4X631_9STRA|nr:Pol protein [Phytophthora palmivora]